MVGEITESSVNGGGEITESSEVGTTPETTEI